MDIRVRPKPPGALALTRLIQQTSFWSRVKHRLGLQPLAFDIECDGQPAGDVLLVSQPVGGGRSLAYAPFGPEGLPPGEQRGLYLAALSGELRPGLGPDCLFVRWDLPWLSDYAHESDRFDAAGHWLGPPEPRWRELRMNWGQDGQAIHKAPSDILPPDTLVLDLRPSDQDLLAAMKPKTRYNIGLAERRGVTVRQGGPEDLDTWYRLYAATAARNRLTPHGPRFFDSLLDHSHGREGVRLLLAERHGRALAAMFLSYSADRASYLYGASSGEDRQYMAPYALQWQALRLAKSLGCSSYDFFGLAPAPDRDHPLYGLYTFKIGFGGSLVHREGAWDYPYESGAYQQYRANEVSSEGFHLAP